MGVKLMSCFGYLPVKKKFKHGSVSVEFIDPSLRQGILGPLITAVTTYYTHKELKSATNNFSSECKVDYGELGLLYKAVLSPDEIVAVKRATRESQQSHSDFQKEVKFLSRIHHKHLVNLCGFCEEKGEQILVYEFVANGSLADHFQGGSGLSLSWRERVHIAICAAKGLAYLHEECTPPVIHKDVKPSNILLDHNFHAKLANFGPNATHMLTGATGTPGYVDPSYVKSNVGAACDIHSFGVVLLQLVTGKPACDGLRDEASYHITDWVKSLNFPISFSQNSPSLFSLLKTPLPDHPTFASQVRLKLESQEFDELLDINLRSTTFDPVILLQMARLGLRCTDLDATSRPLMSKVVQELEQALHAVDELHSNPRNAPVTQPCENVSARISYTGSGYTCRSSGSDFSLPELGGKDSHIKFDGMEWIDIKALEVPDFGDVFDEIALESFVV
ncbi:hypothetical protein KC19_10G042900 [Ceratodon purpureus]|uniref:Protein kinase domain-containing protein n=1 Tax=Ceratodon purpureus TaxID=3225 RepID=A0A8T0GJB3_CERPU|nr:hypothetical protein KC19_10G042900 [Ceratodon purpureus]